MEPDLDKHLGYLCMTYLDFHDVKGRIVKMIQGSAASLDPAEN